MSDPTTILTCILTTYERNGWVSKELAQFMADAPMIPGYGTRFLFAHNFIPAASGRNQFCKQAKDSEADWLCMIDNDMAPQADLFDTVKDAPADAGAVVPAFYMWANDSAKLTLCWGMDQEPERKGRFGRFEPGFHELSKCGTGAIFVRPWVFDKISYPYFRYTYNEDAGMTGTEDIQFCNKLREAGIKIYGNASVQVGHFHSVNLSTIAKLLFDKPVDTGESHTVDSVAAEA